jgi:hypothetical protein
MDIGIKNLSFCLFNVTTDGVKVLKWDNIDLSEKNVYRCIEIDKKGLCDKPAKFMKDDKCYCLKHSKKYHYLQPTKELLPAFLNKQNIKQLIDIADTYKVAYPSSAKKNDILALVTDFYKTNSFQTLEKKNAGSVDLVTIGRNIQYKLDDILGEHLLSIDTIIIENQIGPIANKMKTIQGMIAQYFIMRNSEIKIEFVSASNKLKDYLTKDKKEKDKDKDDIKDIKDSKDKDSFTKPKLDYKQRKQLGITTCLEFMTNDFRFKEWETFFIKSTKKDDLADCFLQGMWYIKYKV